MGDGESDARETPEVSPENGDNGPGAGAHEVAKRPLLDAKGMERPAFLLDFPEDPALAPIIEAFEAGNYARVRRDAPRLAETTGDARVRAAALELRRRIEPDPLAKYLLAVAFALLIVLGVWAYHVQSR